MKKSSTLHCLALALEVRNLLKFRNISANNLLVLRLSKLITTKNVGSILYLAKAHITVHIIYETSPTGHVPVVGWTRPNYLLDQRHMTHA